MPRELRQSGMPPVPTDFRSEFKTLLRQFRKAAGLKQLEIATAIQVHNSEFSRWETGVSYPSLGQLDAIRRELPMRPLDNDALFDAWRREVRKVSPKQLLNSKRPDNLIDHLDLSIGVARTLRQAGQPHAALELAERDIVDCLGRLREFSWTNVHEEVLARSSELVLEHCKAALDFLPRNVVKGGALDNAIRLQNRIAEECKSPRTGFLAKLSEEGATYVGGDIKLAFKQSVALLDFEWPVPPVWKLEALRGAAINAGKMGDRDVLTVVEGRIGNLLEEHAAELSLADRRFLQEGLARGWGALDAGKGIAVLQSSDDEPAGAAGAGGSALRTVQRIRTEGEIFWSGGRTEGRAALLDRIEDGIGVSETNGYDRYVAQLRLLRTKLRA